MPVERRGQVIGIEVVRVNGKPEELDGLDGRRQPLVGGTSRISREVYVRICERLGVKFPGATRRWETGRRSLRQRSRPSSTLQTNRPFDDTRMWILGVLSGQNVVQLGRNPLK
jgi:hypothetical protein